MRLGVELWALRSNATLSHMADRQVSAETRAMIEAVWPEIVDAVATCELTLEKAAIQLAGVGVRSVQRYALQTKGARAELDQALKDGADVMVDRIPELIMTTPDARRARVLAEYYYKIAASRCPERYGQRSAIDLTMRSIDVTQTLIAAQARLEAARAVLPAILGQATRVDEERG